MLRLGFALLLGQEVVRLDGSHAGLLEILSQLALDLCELLLKAPACAFKFALFGLEASCNDVRFSLDLLKLIDLGNEVGELDVVGCEEIRVLLGNVARCVPQLVLMLGNQTS